MARWSQLVLTALILGAAAVPVTAAAAAAAPSTAEGVDFFESRIRPVLAEHCYKCHSVESKKRKGGLWLDSRAALREGGDSGPVLAPGHPEKSRLIEALRYKNPDLQMPPDNPLPTAVVEDFEVWVKMGAPDPRVNSPEAASMARAAQHWSFQQPREQPIPSVKNARWPLNAVDAFILSRLEQAGLSPAPDADKRTLIRRATYDLTGLPPTLEEIDAFIRDDSADAFAHVVDRLLASPRYGERWGRHWLDVARYADTTGPRLGRIPFSYTYRDWVIRAFNTDMPYDEFLVKQLAADKLPDQSDLAALGFLTVGRKSNRDTIHDIIDDWIDVVSRGTLGLTVSCARCHDHKFDPVSTKDYYALYGVFRNSEARLDLPAIGSGPTNDLDRRYDREISKELTGLLDYKKKRVTEISDDLRKPKQIAAYLLAAVNVRRPAAANGETKDPPQEINPFVLRRWRALLTTTAQQLVPYWQPWHALTNLPPEKMQVQAVELADRYARELAAADSPTPHDDPQKEALRRILRGPDAPPDIALADFAEVQNTGPDQGNIENILMLVNALGARYADAGGRPRAMAIEDAPSIRPAHVFVRGNPSNVGEEVPRRFLTIFEGEKAARFTQGSGRLELARKIACADNPLTARVMVNRIWQHHFGAGLVRTPSDFGIRGDAPTHPELLDFLARQFIADGWSIKKMHRLLMLSHVYQQTSADNPSSRNIDPENRLLWRMNRQRTDFESFRDTVLAVSGRLDPTAGGTAIPLFAQPSMRRRTVYGLIDRAQLPVALRAFDFANPEQHTPQRYLTTVPQHTLFMMNDPFMAEHARSLLARREIASERSSPNRIRMMYRFVFGRDAAAAEVELALRFVEEQAENSNSHDPSKASQSPWQLGFGNLNEAAGKLDSFQPFGVFVAANQQLALLSTTFPVFTEVWQVGNRLPDPKAGFANLTALGGEPGGPGYAVVRRWVAPADGTVHLSGSVGHKVAGDHSDGIRARVFSSRKGQLGLWPVAKTSVEAEIKDVEVKVGDSIDFVVDCGAAAGGDEFTWAPTVRLNCNDKDGNKSEIVSASAKEFRGPAPQMLSRWEQLALVLMQSNEFVFID
ncbi:MAG TPA: PSD1 and planctomycete cytochrome C domain-containing protein [Verrucomicrobiae bacterium]|nr:PSD1 and planctomycete cytochrome C domain-containing protein [Verrucomicrobiae bacterium]